MSVPFYFLPVNKPVGLSSHDIVAKVRGAIRPLYAKGTKVGHCGTLDPFASGLLIIAVGKATRFADSVQELPKTYTAVLKLGQTTDTLDSEGDLSPSMAVPELTDERLESCRQAFLGAQEQVPPAYSAKKIKGKRSYELARAGQAVELASCRIHIYDLDLKLLSRDQLELTCTCSKGTYIRCLGRDIAHFLGTTGYLTQLVRSRVGDFNLSSAMELEEGKINRQNLAPFVREVTSCLPQFPRHELPREWLELLTQGRTIDADCPFPECFLGYISDSTTTLGIFLCEYDPQTSRLRVKMRCYLKT